MKRDGLYRNSWLEKRDYCDPEVTLFERDGRDGEREVAIQNKVPNQSPRLARLALSRLTVSDVNEAIKHLFAAARQIGAVGWAHQNLGRLVASPCTPGREDIPANREGRIVAIRSRDGLSLAAILTK
jgi:hypothetical protein